MNFWLISLSHFSLILKILGYKCWGSDKAWKCQSRLSCFTCRACAPGRVVGPMSTILITVFMLMTPKYNRCIKQLLMTQINLSLVWEDTYEMLSVECLLAFGA